MGVARGTKRCLILRREWGGLVMAAPAGESWRPCGAESPNFDMNLLTLIWRKKKKTFVLRMTVHFGACGANI
jgi:hypothetical protein